MLISGHCSDNQANDILFYSSRQPISGRWDSDSLRQCLYPTTPNHLQISVVCQKGHLMRTCLTCGNLIHNEISSSSLSSDGFGPFVARRFNGSNHVVTVTEGGPHSSEIMQRFLHANHVSKTLYQKPFAKSLSIELRPTGTYRAMIRQLQPGRMRECCCNTTMLYGEHRDSQVKQNEAI